MTRISVAGILFGLVANAMGIMIMNTDSSLAFVMMFFILAGGVMIAISINPMYNLSMVLFKISTLTFEV